MGVPSIFPRAEGLSTRGALRQTSELLNYDQMGLFSESQIDGCSRCSPASCRARKGLSTRGALRQTSPPRFNANVGGGEVTNHEKTFYIRERAQARSVPLRDLLGSCRGSRLPVRPPNAVDCKATFVAPPDCAWRPCGESKCGGNRSANLPAAGARSERGSSKRMRIELK